MMIYKLFAIVLLCSSTLAAVQSGRVRSGKDAEKLPPDVDLPLALEGSRPVLVNMQPEDFQACGLDKLTEEELNRLDRWVLDLMVRLQSLPKGQTLKIEPLQTNTPGQQTKDLQRQQLETRLQDLQSRLAMVGQEANRMGFDLTHARMAASRGDLGSVQSSLFGLEASVSRIKRISQ